jgi:DNA gyrase/topoisomerase IV subunit A
MKKIINKTLSAHINVDYRSYATYILESRGIPNFYDALTNVQRFILQNAPINYVKSLKIVGDCISSGYHHGNSSLENALNTLARPYLCSQQIIEGDGFFGNPVKRDAASPRYTSARLSKKSHEILSKYKNLNFTNEGDGWEYLKMEVPLGLLSDTTGIAIGYSCQFLPRKYEHIVEYLEGKRKSLKPFLINYEGNIIKNKEGGTSSWIIEPIISKNSQKNEIYINDISPTIKYEAYVKKINDIIEEYNCNVINVTKDKIALTLKFPKNIKPKELDIIYDKILKFSTAKYSENIVFIKDKNVLEYDTIEDYLDDFKNYREFLFKNQIEYDLNKLEFELEYLKARKLYLEYMLTPGTKTNAEIESFLQQFEKNIYHRLDALKLRLLNKQFLKETESLIKEIISLIKSKKIELNNQSKTCNFIKNIIIKAKTSTIKK